LCPREPLSHLKIIEIRAYRVELPLVEGSYRWSGGNEVKIFDSTIVRIETDSGLVGFGEVCPLGPAYLPAYAEGARTGIAMIAPSVLGLDPTELGVLNRQMDRSLKGHAYVKSPIDVACWDILGKATNLPIVTLLGGRYGRDYPLYRAISQNTPEKMAESVAKYRREGYKKFQLKVGGNVETDVERTNAVSEVLGKGELLVADANTGFSQHEAIKFVDQIKELDVYIEQPCRTYEECLAVRAKTSKPFILDEIMDSSEKVVRAISDHAMDAINLKISKVGGLTKARQIRDLCLESGIALTIEDSWGGDIATTAISHLAHSTPGELLLSTTDFNSYVTKSLADGAPKRKDGKLEAPKDAGLGISVREEELGEPVLVVK
jgi:cis-L-3-hydroxyproline dehydratase